MLQSRCAISRHLARLYDVSWFTDGVRELVVDLIKDTLVIITHRLTTAYLIIELNDTL
jgi:hypothetical protein